MNVEQELRNLTSKNTELACHSFDKLIDESEKTDLIYPYWNTFFSLLDSVNAYQRMRGLSLISVNSQWDTEDKLAASLPKFLEKLNDHKPIVVRVCIKRLYAICENFPSNVNEIKIALENMDLSGYKESMREIISRDRDELLEVTSKRLV